MRTSATSIPSARRSPSAAPRHRLLLLLVALLSMASLATGCSGPRGAAGDHADAATRGVTNVVRSSHDLVAYAAPDTTSAQRVVPAATPLGSSVALLVTAAKTDWVQVLVPGRPTGATAWIPAAGLDIRTVTSEIHVDLATRTLTVRQDGKVVLTTPAAVGAPGTPTPVGRFSVTDKLDTQDPSGSYGRYAFGLSGRSAVLTEFAGGDGQIGIHGTDDPSSIGRNVSHGCIRVSNDVMARLNAMLPLGTPVVVG